MPQRGILYVATGEKFRKEAERSIQTLERNEINIPVALAADEEIDSKFVDYFIKIENPDRDYLDKIRYISKSPFEKTLFLDTDTFIYDNLDGVFQLLDEFELAIAHSPGRTSISLEDVPESFPEMNTGVILFRNSERIDNLLGKWEEIYQRRKTELPHDQAAFRKALYMSDVSYSTLTPEYNCRFGFPTSVSGEVKVFHGRDSGMLLLPTLSFDIFDFMDKVNEMDGMRVIYPSILGIRVRNAGYYNLLNRFLTSLKKEGIVRTWEKIERRIKNRL